MKSRQPLKAFFIFVIFLLSLGLKALAVDALKPELDSKFSLINLYDQKFEKLNRFSRFNSNILKGQNSLWILFQPKCSSCESQFKNLNCISDSIALVALGIKGTREKLLRSIQFSKFKGYQLTASDEFEDSIDFEGTPTLLFVNRLGYIEKKLRGLKACSEINDVFNTSYFTQILRYK